jgi:hypothetical protein
MKGVKERDPLFEQDAELLEKPLTLPGLTDSQRCRIAFERVRTVLQACWDAGTQPPGGREGLSAAMLGLGYLYGAAMKEPRE